MYKIKLKNLITIAMLLFLLNTAIDIFHDITVRVSRYASDMTHDALMRTCALLAAYGKTTDLNRAKVADRHKYVHPTRELSRKYINLSTYFHLSVFLRARRLQTKTKNKNAWKRTLYEYYINKRDINKLSLTEMNIN